MAGKTIVIGSILSSVLLVLTIFPPVVAYRQVALKESQTTSHLVSLPKKLSEKQVIILMLFLFITLFKHGIIIKLYLFITLLLVFIESLVAHKQDKNIWEFISDLKLILCTAWTWPLWVLFFLGLMIAEIFFGFNPHP
jgi:hypothetical protein